jgi:hypothetical protein
MPPQARLWSVNQLSIELAKNARTITKALAGVAPDGQLKGGHPGYTLVTAFEALRRYTKTSDQLLERAAMRSNGSGELSKLEPAAQRVERLLQDLRCEGDVGRRRALVERDGTCVGQLDRLLVASAQELDGREIYQPYVDRVMATAMGEILSLCDWAIEAKG